MNAADLYNEITVFCRSNSDDAIIRKYSRYFKNGQYDAYGLPLDIINGKVKEITDRPGTDYNLLREVSLILAGGKKFEEVTFAFLFYKTFIKKADRRVFDDITLWYERGIGNWAHSDSICGELLFPLLKKNIIIYKDFEPWLTGRNKFQRRSVPVALIKQVKLKKVVQPYLDFVEPLMKDSEREVHQGIGWFLREAWRIDNEEVEKLLLRWKESAARLIYQYACEKMSSEAKTKFRRTK